MGLMLMIADPKLLAAVAHEGAIKPKNNEKYRKILEQRRLESEQTRRQVASPVAMTKANSPDLSFS